jgi:hypothetical protein
LDGLGEIGSRGAITPLLLLDLGGFSKGGDKPLLIVPFTRITEEGKSPVADTFLADLMPPVPESISRKFAEFIGGKGLQPEDVAFPTCYSTAGAMIKKCGSKLNIKVFPHDRKHHSATYAS